MVRTHRMVMAVAIGIAILSRSAAAQHGSSASLTHTVSVTVPPRVKVQVGSLAPVVASNVRQEATAPAQGLALSISATRAWVLSIGSGNSSSSKSATVRWSIDATSGYSKLTSDQVTVASGTLSSTPTDSMLFFQNLPQVKSRDAVASEAPVVLTVTAP